MVSLIVLLGVAGLLLLVGVGEHLVSQGLAMARLAWARGVVCLAGMVAVVAVGAGETGFGFAADGLSRVVIAALFLVVATGGAGLAGVAGALAIAMLAADGAVLVVAVAVAVVLSAGMRGPWMGWGAVGCLAVAVLVAGWHDGAFDPRFVAMRGGEAQDWSRSGQRE